MGNFSSVPAAPTRQRRFRPTRSASVEYPSRRNRCASPTSPKPKTRRVASPPPPPPPPAPSSPVQHRARATKVQAAAPVVEKPRSRKVVKAEKISTVVKSSYANVEASSPPPTRARSTSPVTTRRDYASPSLVEEQHAKPVLGPSTSRKIQKLSTKVESPAAEAPPNTTHVERFSQAAPTSQGNPTELLFSYLNAV